MGFGDKAEPKAEPKEPELETRFLGMCVGGDQEMARKLARYPNLVHAPGQWGEGIRTHMKGVLVDDIAKGAKGAGLIAAIDRECEKRGVDIHELLDAIRFARDNGAL